MEQLMNRIKSGDPLRWSVGALFVVLSIAVVPEYWAAERLPRELQYVRALTIVVPLVLSILLYRARHESPLRQFPLMVGLVTTTMVEAALKIGLTGRVVALLVVWVVVVWIEWRRVVEEEQRFA